MTKRNNKPLFPLYIVLAGVAAVFAIGLLLGSDSTEKGWASISVSTQSPRSYKETNFCAENDAKEFTESQLKLNGTIEHIDINLDRENGCNYIFQGLIWSYSPSRRALVWIEVSAESGEWRVIGDPVYDWI